MNEALPPQQFELIRQIQSNLESSAVAYHNYLREGKTFMLAKVLKIHNSGTRLLLLEKKNLLPLELQNDAGALIAHYDKWLEKWNDLEKQLSPSPGDEFIFANKFTFPKEAAKNIEKEYTRLKTLQ